MNSLSVIALSCVVSLVWSNESIGAAPSCVYYQGNAGRLSTSFSVVDREPHTHLSTVTDARGQSVNVTQCKRSSNYCYAFWQEVEAENNETVPVILSQGCWESSGQFDCRESVCVASKKPWKAQHQTQSRFCCCSGNLCNLNVSVEEAPAEESPVPSLTQSSAVLADNLKTAAFCTVIVFLCILAAAGVVWGYVSLKRRSRKSDSPTGKRLPEDPLHREEASVRLDNLKLIEVIGHGRYGTVWKSSLDEKTVAVKVFSPQCRTYFLNERYIYTLPLMEHPNLIGYLGSQEALSLDGYPELRLVLEYAPMGSLQEYLRTNSLDWQTLCKMGRSVACGLAHLHTDIVKGDKKKPCVAHRDINSRNILVKPDLSCCLADMGFAMHIAGGHYYNNGEEQHAETTSLTDVGTLRYMAPEVLEGAVNLRECEASLKQIDVYALGLVLWEIAFRCADLYPSKEAPPYQLPFEAEIGVHPSIEQIKTLVCRHKARPLFPETWRDTNPGVRLLKATLEDAWDQDAEARLTALCVEERWNELPALWERGKTKSVSSGVHPNPTHAHGDTEGDSFQLKNGNSSTHLGAWPPSPRPLQPHQGRNPCLERNTMSQGGDEQSASGQALVDRSSKHVCPRDNSAVRYEPSSSETRSSGSVGGYAPLARIANPIPYLQNAVHETGPQPSRNPSREAGGLGSFFSGLLRFKGHRKDLNSLPTDPQWEEKQSLCPVLSSPSDAADSSIPPMVVVVKSNNNDRTSAAPRGTEVRWNGKGLTNVALVKVKSNLVSPEQNSLTINNPSFTDISSLSSSSPMDVSAQVEVGVAKQEAGLGPGHSPLVKRRSSWKETKPTTANHGCDTALACSGLASYRAAPGDALFAGNIQDS